MSFFPLMLPPTDNFLRMASTLVHTYGFSLKTFSSIFFNLFEPNFDYPIDLWHILCLKMRKSISSILCIGLYLFADDPVLGMQMFSHSVLNLLDPYDLLK